MKSRNRIAPKGKFVASKKESAKQHTEEEYQKLKGIDVFLMIGISAMLILILIFENNNPSPSYEQDYCIEMKSVEECNTFLKVNDFVRERVLEEKYIYYFTKRIVHQTAEQIKEQQEGAKNEK